MQRLRTTFARSRTPNGSEMKGQRSLEVPKQVRSASFDEMKLERTSTLFTDDTTDDEIIGEFLEVPQSQSKRSKSFDLSVNDDIIPQLDVSKKYQIRQPVNYKINSTCIHCDYLKKNSIKIERDHYELVTSSCSEYSNSDEECSENENLKFGNLLVPPSPLACNVKLTISNANEINPLNNASSKTESTDTTAIESVPNITTENTKEEISKDEICVRTRRKSISRQEAIILEPTENSLENITVSEIDESETKLNIVTRLNSVVIQDIYLTVPDLRRDRAASVDSCFSKVSQTSKTEELQFPDGRLLDIPNINTTRSRSVDIVLPTDEQSRYKALAFAESGASFCNEGKPSGTHKVNAARQIRIVPDWSENAINGDHLWTITSASGDLCCVPEECRKSGQRMRCSACLIIAHLNCIPFVNEKVQLSCKPTFRDVGARQYRSQTKILHHWVHRRAEKSKCKNCGKAFQNKLFGSKEIVALSCAWCKVAYHNKETCFTENKMEEECKLGPHANIIVPPSWIVKLSSKENFKSSLRTPKKRISNRRKSKEKEQRIFVVKPIPTMDITPVLVFINPKSGGNQGIKLLQKFQWLLNPRQVFDLTQGGPRMGLELFRKAPKLRLLACGGDGTVGWVLSVLDQINIQPQPAVGVLPLGTGNDLARALGWGGGYEDEPIGKILSNIGKSDTILLDRWSLKVEPNTAAEPTDEGKENLPLNVVNNYFSFGVDAHIALEFHEAREAHPEKFNSRLRNKMFYGQAGGKDLLQRKWKSLADFVTLECDEQDYTHKLKEHRVHAILFLNIPSYGGGTHPWNKSAGTTDPKTDDGLIEVVGLTTYQLPLLQAGGHGTCICQCKSAKIVTTKTIPMQVDGEAAKLKPSIIELSLLNQAVMLAKKKPGRTNVQLGGILPLNVSLHRITMPEYEQHFYDKELLKQCAVEFGTIEIEPVADLEQVRTMINKYCEESSSFPKLSSEWCFVDGCTADRFFRIDKAQENLHYITDIATDIVYVLDEECVTVPQTPDNDRSFAAFQYKQEGRQKSNEKSSNPELNRIIPKKDRKIANIAGRINFKSSLLEKTSQVVLHAAQIGDLSLLRALHEQGYSLLSLDSNGQTALHLACKYNNKDIVKYLITCAPSSIINMVENIKYYTALHFAAFYKRREISVMLVAAGANLSLRDRDGCTPMMLAFNVDAFDLAAYFESQERFLKMDIQATI